MHENFSPEPVTELGDARSYASRLFDYGATGTRPARLGGRAAREDPASRSRRSRPSSRCSDTSYIPCVSMLDFWAPDGALELVVYAHSLDFGKKAYGNLVELARLQAQVAGELGLAVGG